MEEHDPGDLTPEQLQRRWREFGAWLADELAAAGMSRSQFAGYSGLSFQTLTHLQNTVRNVHGTPTLPNPSDATVVRLARGLSRAGRPVTAEQLFDRIGGRQRERPQRPQANADGAAPPAPPSTVEARLQRAEQELARLRALVEAPEDRAAPRRRAR